MKRCVGDLEANGLLTQADKVHCCVLKDIDTGEIVKFHPGSHIDYIGAMLQYL